MTRVAILDMQPIDPPTGGPVASVADEGSFEFLIVLVPG